MFQRQQGLGQLENPSLIANMPLDASASSGISSTAGMPVSNNSQGMQVEGEAAKASSINRHHSFAGLRENVQVTYFVDGEEYFSAVADALNEAKEYIFIEDWWMSPQVHLKRPALSDKTWRLDELLKKKAQEGVKVWIVIYKEVNLALALNSRYVKEWMNNLHPNIKVQRHPDHEGENSVLRWAHHEKMVIVDSKIAFVGGLDLCFGRYDSHSHRLADPTEIIWYGQDYNNPRRKDFVNVNDYKKTLIDRQVFPRMPWHDISMKVTGLAAYDVARHFCERWNFIKKVKGQEKTDIPILDPGLKNAEAYAQKVKGTCVTQVLRSSSKWSSGVSHEKSIQNAYLDLINNAEHFIYIENQFFISNPTTKSDYEISNQIANALVKRIFRAYDENKPFRVIVAMPLMPAFESDIDDKNANTLRLVMHWQYTTISRGGNSIFEQLIGKGIRPSDYISFYGLRQYDLIRDKKHYPAPTKEELLNMEQADFEDAALESERKESHLSAHLPSFITSLFRRGFKKEVEVVEAESSTLTEIRSDLEQDSLYVTELLYIHSKLMIVDDKYVICGSANINDRSMRGDRDSEIAILVEDKSEVNSRMNGQPYKVGRVAQDLRIKIFCEHLGLTPETSIKFLANHGPHYVPHFYRGNDAYMQKIRNLLQDPLSPDFWKLWSETAKENTEIYRRVFHCVPDDNITTWEEYKKFVPDKTKVAPGHVVDPDLNKAQIQKQVHQIQGHLVEFPTAFLAKEELKARKLSAERYLSEDVFT